ncbi:MAG: methyltransferase domain-containing protein [Calditrichia bacterium]|nr:methyltransferase domain-containing protein [Calditrichia bacterium]
MVTNWYENWFGNEYLTVYAHRDEDEARELVQLILTCINLDKNAKIIDLCCGQGRHAFLFAQEGFEVYGFDLSRTLLQVAKYKNDQSNNTFFIQADMRYLPAMHSFDLLLNLFTSFGYFETDIENKIVFQQFHQVLNTGGYFVFDYFHTPYILANLERYQSEQIGDLTVELERFIEGSRVQKIIRLNRQGKQSTFYESVKMYKPDQILKMMEETSLSVRYIFGDYKGSPLSEDSERIIIIGQKE